MKEILKKLVPASLWAKIRLKRILADHQRVADFWNPLIDKYEDGQISHVSITPKKRLLKPVIWQYWGQGFDGSLPEIVKICLDSVDKYVDKSKYDIIRLTDETVKDYLDLPDYVHQRLTDGKFSRTHFSDLLRLALLYVYGGVWIDATILLTEPIPEDFLKANFFAFQRSDDEPYKKYWEGTYAYYFGWHRDYKVRILSSFMVSSKQTGLMVELLSLMLYYWETENRIIDYFFFQILFNEVLIRHPEWNCDIISDTLPHLMQTKMNGNWNAYSNDDIVRLTNIHKLSTKVFSLDFIKKCQHG